MSWPKKIATKFCCALWNDFQSAGFKKKLPNMDVKRMLEENTVKILSIQCHMRIWKIVFLTSETTWVVKLREKWPFLSEAAETSHFFPVSPVSIIEKPGVLLPDGLRVSSIIFPGDRAIKQIRNLSDQQTARRTDQCVGYGWESGWALLALAMYGVNYK